MTASETPAHPPVTADQSPQQRYGAALAAEIEQRWRARWVERGTFNAPNPVGDFAPRAGEAIPDDKLFVLDMFPYPSGAGLHVGHPLGYIATDVYARYHRMLGANVLHTMGFDAFGLPAEQYAVQTGAHPRATTETNIARYLQQIERLGLGHDERRRIATTDVDFYHWTQWIFLQIYNAWYDEAQHKARPIADLIAEFDSGTRPLGEAFASRGWAELSASEQNGIVDGYRLVYQSDSLVNWCPGLGTVLANEEVTADGRSDRGNFPVFRKNLRQWMMRITAYSDRLIDDLGALDWPEKVKSMQRNWIGRSTGARIGFTVPGAAERVEVYSTQPDTLFGATFVVLSPEHPLVDVVAAAAWPEGTDPRWTNGGASTPAEAVAAYRNSVAAKTDLDRQEAKTKSGTFIGAYAHNPITGDIPIFIADYVLMGFGTGAVMAVPAHDQRDYDFATQFGLPMIEVIGSDQGIAAEAYVGPGLVINSATTDLDINGLEVAEAKTAVIEYLHRTGYGHAEAQYKLRDWLFARQRYWGEPFPIVIDDDGAAHALPESDLPVLLPEVEDYAPVSFDPDDADSNPSPPLAKAVDWVNVELDLGDGLKHYARDTNVMPQWAGSSWYQMRYVDPTNRDAFCDSANEQYWLGPRPAEHGADDPGGVDLYVGGVEHAVLHLLYARFWQKVLYDLGHVTAQEPFRRLFNQGYIQAYAYTDARGVYVPAEDVTETDGEFFYAGEPVHREYGKMGKSLKNSVTPDDICDAYGADTLRVYEMSMGPLDQSRAWATKDVVGAHRFLQRVWRITVNEDTGALAVTDDPLDEPTLRVLHRTIAGVREDYTALRDNTAVAKLIGLTNHLTKHFDGGAPRAAVEPLVLMLAPVAPHLAEELWNRLGHQDSLSHGPFPQADEQWLREDTIEIPVQVKGKVRSRITVAADATAAQLETAALADEKIVALLEGAPRKVIVVPGKLVNVVP